MQQDVGSCACKFLSNVDRKFLCSTTLIRQTPARMCNQAFYALKRDVRQGG